MELQSLTDIFKSMWNSPVDDVPVGRVGCLHCRNAAPWVLYAFECAHHSNRRASREWNRRHEEKKRGWLTVMEARR